MEQENCCSAGASPQTQPACKANRANRITPYLPAIISALLLLAALAAEHLSALPVFMVRASPFFYLLAYLPVALPVWRKALFWLKRGDIFTEFFLMGLATVGAFAIGEYPEAVAVMLFYTLGELLQASAVQKAGNSIKALIDAQPKVARVRRGDKYITTTPELVGIGEKISVKAGEKVPIDGYLCSAHAIFDTAALSGESKPQTILKGQDVASGFINLGGPIVLKTNKKFEDSAAGKILDLVQNARAKKAKTELLIRKLAKIYTPLVTLSAVALVFIPYFFVENYIFNDWLYRGLMFLVISCPCALVISIPLGYFGGLGAASKHGILFKGANYLEKLAKVDTVAWDKTGTLTKGVFKIKDIVPESPITEKEFMHILCALENKSAHPIAKAFSAYNKNPKPLPLTDIQEIAGKGLCAKMGERRIVAGNKILLQDFHIKIPPQVNQIAESLVLLALDGEFSGYVTLSDQLKDDAAQTIAQIKTLGVGECLILSGDKQNITQKVAQTLGINTARGALLPQDKLAEILRLKAEQPTKTIAFVGDGINDAPVLAAADIGIAIGASSSDAAIETADVVLRTNQPSKLLVALKISRATRRIIRQNIALVLIIKILILLLGAAGMASIWQAVFSDVGVALLAVLNAVRLQKMRWE